MPTLSECTCSPTLFFINSSMNFTKFLFLFLAGGLLLQACDSFEETNIDPSRPTEVPLNLIMPTMLTQAAFNQSANESRIAGIILQYLAGIDAQQAAYQRYTIPAEVTNNYWRTGLYAGVLKDADVMIAQAQAEDAPYYEAIAEIISAMSYADAASKFGDIPYGEALQGGDNLQPAYTPQLEVFAGIQNQLDRAIELLNTDGGTVQPGGDDIIFGGNPDLWKQTAWALKARYLMHLVNREPGNAAKVLDIVQNNAFQSAAEQPNFAYGTSQTDNSPFAKFGQERPNTLIVEDVSINAGSFATRLIERNDPRASRIFEETLDADGNGTGFYIYYNANNPNLIYARFNSVIPYISFTELQFLEAEALERTGEDATDALKDAIRSSFAQYELDVDEDFIESTIGDDTDLEEIITEAYVAYYGIAHQEAWTNYRRTGFPDIQPVDNPDDSFNPSGIIPERWLYPTSEINLNTDNVQAAIDRQGGNLLDDELAAFAN